MERDRVFDRMADSFTDSYAEAYANTQFSDLVELAIEHFNNKSKKKNIKYGVASLQSMCSFFESRTYPSQRDHYVHLNFSAHTTNDNSTTMLFFAELKKNVKNDTTAPTWTVLSCEPLVNDSPGGLNGKVVEKQGKRKRKIPTSCFACQDDIKHPEESYVAGHFVNYTYV